MTDDITELLVVTAIAVVAYIAYKHGLFSGLLPSGGGGDTTTTTGGTTPAAGNTASSGNCGKTIYPGTGKVANGGPGKNQHITYASSGAGATSHRTDILGWTATNYEATVYLTWPAAACGKDHLTIKFWGPGHTDSTCCWCLVTLGGAGDVSFGGEGPHPNTSTSQKGGTSVGNIHGKKVGFKGVIWKTGASIHQEAYVDLGGSWKQVGVNDRPTCGFNKTITAPVASQDVEFRFDCGSVVYDCTTVAEIKPGGAIAAYTRSYEASIVPEGGLGPNTIKIIHIPPYPPPGYPYTDFGNSCED